MRYVGVDGCKYGWVSVCFSTEEIIAVENIENLISYYPAQALIFIDVPIGLKSEKNKLRNCEELARQLLPKNRKSSIFPVPCRESLQAETYSEASYINKAILGKGISMQTWFIISKIKEIDQFLVQNKQERNNIKESHPEISFQFLNDGKPLKYTKKTENGIFERLHILSQFKPEAEKLYKLGLKKYRRKEVAKDDLLDAMCLGITAELSEIYGKRIPIQPEKDEYGIKMAIHYADFSRLHKKCPKT
ncbi:DUF429 domain-containing protein [Christiangramia sp. LLG6405-1]|uniref:DUF429 domain-containing protein n=1 Tax=Christiangramia sp. LLG6405-1 TaxID=3160832 RepID=UPI003868F65E